MLIELATLIYFIMVAHFLGLVGVVYSIILTEPGMIFFNLYEKLQRKLPVWLFKPVIGCALCVSGQMALWCFMILYTMFDFWFAFALHTMMVSVAIYSAKIYLYLNKKLSA